MKKHLLFLGPPGAGKGTQAKFIVDNFGMLQLSTGDMLREAKNSGSEIGKVVSEVMQRGDLVTDDIVIDLISSKIDTSSNHTGFIFDGFPRTLNQADALSKLLSIKNKPINYVIELRVNDDVLIERIIGRYSCNKCGEVYHEKNNPTKIPLICDVCGEKDNFMKRPDDNESSLKTRLMSYYKDTSPLIGYYHVKKLLKTINALDEINNVYRNIETILKS